MIDDQVLVDVVVIRVGNKICISCINSSWRVEWYEEEEGLDNSEPFED